MRLLVSWGSIDRPSDVVGRQTRCCDCCYRTVAWGYQHRCILDLSATAPPAYEVFRSSDAERARRWGGSGLRKLHGTRQVMADGPFKVTVGFTPSFNRPGGFRWS